MPKIFSEEERKTVRFKLIQAGINELEHKNFKSIAIDDIVAEVGIAKGTFYNFFTSKEAYFYEIMQFIKEKNRLSLKDLLKNGKPSRDDITDCLYKRYTETKTIYEYFSPADIKVIMRKIPADNMMDDSIDFAGDIFKNIRKLSDNEAKTIVGMFNILGVAAANKSLIEKDEYNPAIKEFCVKLADYILGE